MPLLLYVVAVLPAAAIGGWPAGVVTAAVAVGAGYLLILDPHALATTPELIRALAFVLVAIAISGLLDVLQRRSRRARELAAALAEERDRVARMALEDELTGLRNRRAFRADLTTEMARSQREGMSLTLVMADIDGLKQTNDRLGHEEGDCLLKATAAALRECCRAADAAYRIGGDEFALLMPDTGPNDFGGPYRRLKDAFAGVSRSHEGAGVSMGWAYTPKDSVDAEELLRLADGRMYEEKAARHREGVGRTEWRERAVAGHE